MIDCYLARLGGDDAHHFDYVVGVCSTREEAEEVARTEALKAAEEEKCQYYVVTHHDQKGNCEWFETQYVESESLQHTDE